MRLFTLFFIGLLPFCLILASPVQATGSLLSNDQNLRIEQGVVTLSSADSPYFLSSLDIGEGATLVINPGVRVILSAGAAVTIEGSLIASGIESAPVTFESLLPSERWGGLLAFPSSHVKLQHVVISAFLGPIEIQSSPEISNLSLVDGVMNRLIIGAQNSTYPSLHLDGLTFANYGAGDAMQSSGLIFRGDHPGVLVENLHFFDTRPITAQIGKVSVRIEGTYGQATFSELHFPHECSATINSFRLSQYYELIPDTSRCPKQDIPVVFVPGFGTSINLDRLTSVDLASPQLTGWRFFKQLTPAYTQFLTGLAAQHINYQVAFYDWRLPASQAEGQYLEPVIESTKHQYNVDCVNLVAHSYGGLLARSYIESDHYKGDVCNLVQLGTPNAGAAKVYPVWEASQIPKDWEAAEHLLRLYTYKSSNPFDSRTLILHKTFPSVLTLMPVYPAVENRGNWLAPSLFINQNSELLDLNRRESLLISRVPTTVLASDDLATIAHFTVGPQHPEADTWQDGIPSADQIDPFAPGDGTVPVESAGSLPGATITTISGSHGNLTASGLENVLDILYPSPTRTAGTFTPPADLPLLSFLFDCPVTVSITLPDGTMRNSNDSDAVDKVGETATDPDLIWMLLPRMEGVYKLTITAQADTEVRNWVDFGTIHTRNLLRGDQLIQNVTIGSLDTNPQVRFVKVIPATISTPTPVPIVSIVTPAPSPTPKKISLPNPTPSPFPVATPVPMSTDPLNRTKVTSLGIVSLFPAPTPLPLGPHVQKILVMKSWLTENKVRNVLKKVQIVPIKMNQSLNAPAITFWVIVAFFSTISLAAGVCKLLKIIVPPGKVCEDKRDIRVDDS